MELTAALESVLAAPADDAPRLVYADALLEAGDPMGEFLRLEYARARKETNGVENQRVQDLLIMNWKRWLGPLAAIVQRRASRFDRGFLSSAVIGLPGQVDERKAFAPSRIAEIAACPLWRLVDSLEVTAGRPADVAAVLESPQLTRLTSLSARVAALGQIAPQRLAFSLAQLTVALEPGEVLMTPAWARLEHLRVIVAEVAPNADTAASATWGLPSGAVGRNREGLPAPAVRAAMRASLPRALVASAGTVEVGQQTWPGPELSELLAREP